MACRCHEGHNWFERNLIELVLVPFSVEDSSEEGGRIIDDSLLARYTSIMNTFYKQRESHKWTYNEWNGEVQQYVLKSMIDLFLTWD